MSLDPLPQRGPRAATRTLLVYHARMATPLGRLLPDLEDPRRNLVREAWDRLSRLPGGKRIFSELIGRAAPYSGSIGASVRALSVGHSEVQLRDRPRLRNHLRCVHAIALANLAELTGNVALAYSLPADARFIVAGLDIEYVKKARGTITGLCDCQGIVSSERREYLVAVRMVDAKDEVVARATLRTLVGPKKGRA